MWILKPSNSSHDVFCVARYTDNPSTLRVDLYDENLRTTSTIVPEDNDLTGAYLLLRIKRPVTEGQSFGVTVYDSANNDLVYWRGKAFCTDQTPQEYKINT